MKLNNLEKGEIEMAKCICCEKEEYARGLCINTYQYVLRKIKQGKTTWQEMEQQGKCKINRKSKYTNLVNEITKTGI